MDITEIFTNPLVWAFLAWLFSRAFTSKGKEEPKKPKQSTQQPRHRQEPRANPRPNPRPAPKPVMTTIENKQRDARKPPLQSVQEAYEKLKLTEDKVQVRKEKSKEVEPLKHEELPKVNRSVGRHHLVIDQQKAAQGVIWSEVLGAPRAKNPHYTQKRRHS